MIVFTILQFSMLMVAAVVLGFFIALLFVSDDDKADADE